MFFGFVGDAGVMQGAAFILVPYIFMEHIGNKGKWRRGGISRFVTTHGIDSVFSGDGDFVVFSGVGHFVVV